MEIPYTVKPRPDTGLWNAKIGIWLFLASEVMLFGGLFSGYIFLRMGAEPGFWPHGLLNVPMGMINTAILIFSSVTMVFAWAALKMRKWSSYRNYMLITIICGATFMGIKLGYEWPAKFHHFGAYLKPEAMEKYEEYLGNRHLAEKGLEPRVKITGILENHSLDNPEISFYQIRLDPANADPTNEINDKPRFFPLPISDKVIEVAKEDVRFASMYTPRHSTYFAIYYTITGLHGLHIIGGLLVFAYFLLPVSKRLYEKDPEHLANRVEVAGLFWHFVDLVWIFAFPIFYLL